MIYGMWQNRAKIGRHEGFADVANVLGQDHLGGSPGVPADSVDRDKLWDAAKRSTLAINDRHG
jgi:hypothetical protein